MQGPPCSGCGDSPHPPCRSRWPILSSGLLEPCPRLERLTGLRQTKLAFTK